MALPYDPNIHDSEVVHAQFQRLLNELIRGAINRNTFQPWEIELLLDIQACDFGDSSQKEVLKRYQKAVQRAYEKGAKMPMKLSEYLDQLKQKRLASAAARADVSRQIAS